jgi:hypothetical protein
MMDGKTVLRRMPALLVAIGASGDLLAAEKLPWQTNEPIATIRREPYMQQEHAEYPIFVKMYSAGPGLERWEVVADETSGADEWENLRSRVSSDNGRTWSKFTRLPNNIVRYKRTNAWEGDDLSMPLYDPASGALIQTWLRQLQPKGKPHINFTYYRMSRDHGRTWSTPRQLKYELGPDFDPADPLNAEFISKNVAYLPPNIVKRADGSLVLCVGNVPNRLSNQKGVKGEEMGAVCFMGRWNKAKDDYDWTTGAPVFITPKQSSRGLMETNVAELKDGRVLVVWRASNAGMKDPAEADAAGHKLFSLSSDGGKTLSPVAEWKYDDDSRFYSPSSFHRIFRHNGNGRLYWIGNISATRPSGNHPRYPLVIAEIDEEQAALKKNTVTAIADRRPEFSELFQLSNFSILENPENHTMELLLVDYDGGFKGLPRRGDCYKYTLEFRR